VSSACALVPEIVADRVQQQFVECAHLAIRRGVSTPNANADTASGLAAAVTGIHCAVTVLRTAIPIASFPSIAALGWFPTVRLLVHMKDLTI